MDFADSFLQSYMQGQSQQAEARRQLQGFMFQNFWNQAKLAQENQQEQARLQQQKAYQDALIQDTQARQGADIAEHQLTAQRNGAVPAQPMAAPAALSAAQPTTADVASLPATQPTLNPIQRSDIALPREGDVNLGGMLLHQQTPAELAQQQQEIADQQSKAVAARIQQGVAAGLYTPEQAKTILALHGLKTAMGGNLNEAEAAVISPKPTAIKEGDEPLTQDEIDRHNKAVADLAAVNGVQLGDQYLLHKGDTRNARQNVQQMLERVQSAVGTKVGRDAAAAARAQAEADRQQMLGIQRDRENDRVATENEKYVGPARDAVQFARDYMATKNFTGAGDEQLQERFFDAIKPSSGFRMTKAMMDLQQKLQSVEQRGKAIWANLTGGTLYSPQLRQDVADQIEAAHKMKAAGLASKGKAAPVTPTPAPTTTAAPGAPKVQRWGRDAQGNPVPLP